MARFYESHCEHANRNHGKKNRENPRAPTGEQDREGSDNKSDFRDKLRVVITFGRVEVCFNRWLIRVIPSLGKVALLAVIQREPQKPLQLRRRSGLSAFGRRFVAEF